MSDPTMRGPNDRPPIASRPPCDKPLSRAELFQLWLDSVSTVRINGYMTPVNAPLTPEEADIVEAYLRST